MKFDCSICGKTHDVEDISFGADAPAQWYILSEEERSNSELGEEQCIINAEDETHFFIRACLEIPIKGTNTFFNWGVWVSLSEKSFNEISDAWDDPERVNWGPHFGWLCTQIPEYPDTMFLKTKVYQRKLGFRPLVELEPSDNLLCLHRHEGIDSARIKQIVIKLLHRDAQQTSGADGV